MLLWVHTASVVPIVSGTTVDELLTDEVFFLEIVVGHIIQVIGKEEHAQDTEHDEKFDENQCP